MNKLFSKIAIAIASFAMVTGAGAVIATQQTNPVYADAATMTGVSSASAAKVNSKDALKCGTGSKAGSMSITLASAGATTLTVYVGGWNNDANRTVKVTATSGVSISPASFTLENESAFTGTGTEFTVENESKHLQTFTLSGAVENTVVTLTANTAKNNRFVVWAPSYTIGAGNDDPVDLTNPNPQYDDEIKVVSWAKDNNATKYQVKVDAGSYEDIETPTYDARSLTVGEEHTVSIKAVGDGTKFNSVEGSVKFTPTEYEIHRIFTVTGTKAVEEAGDVITGAVASYSQTTTNMGQCTGGNSATLSINSISKKVTVSKLVLSMKSNKSAGAGSVSVIADGEETFIAGTASDAGVAFNNMGDNKEYTTTFKKVTWDNLNFVAKSSIQIKIYGTENSIYIESYRVYFVEEENNDYVSALSVTPSTWNGYTTSTLRLSDFKVSVTTGGVEGSELDYIFLGIGHMEDGEFVARNDHFEELNPRVEDTRLYWKAKYPTAPGGSTYLYAYVTLTVSEDSVSTINITGNMDKTSYYSTDRWQIYGLTATAVYGSGNTRDVTYLADITYYTDAEMTNEVASPDALGVGNNQPIFIKATYEGVSNTVGYEQTVNVSYEHGYLITDPLTADEAIAIGAQRGNNGETQVEYYVLGTVISVEVNQLDQEGKNKYATFFLEESNEQFSFEAYRIAPSESCTNYEDLKEGAVVLLRCRLKNYLNTTIENGSTGELVSISYTKEVLSGIALNKTSIILTVGNTSKLTVSAVPLSAEFGEVTWTSSDENIATVTEGSVKGIAAGSATITASANGFEATCTVNVYNGAKMSYSGSDTANMTETDNAKTVGLDEKLFTVDASKNDASTMPGLNKNGEIRLYQDYSKGGNGSSFTVKMDSKFTIAAIQIEFKSGEQNATVYAGAKAVTSGNNIFEINADSFTVKDTGTDRVEINSIDIFYRAADVRETVGRLSTQTSLAYNYTRDAEDNFTYSDIVIRFGANISKEMWNELAAENEITGFGVMIADGDIVKNSREFADVIEGEIFTSSAVSTDVSNNYAIDYFVPAANMGTIIGENDDNYFWNLRFSVDSANIGTMYSAVAYIKVGNEYVVMNMARESVKTVAADYIANRGCDNTTAGGSLAALAK